jgi:hypothetical protein
VDTPTPTTTELVVEGAGCESCGALIRDVFVDDGLVVHAVVVDEARDVATVTVEGAVDGVRLARALSEASTGTGHAYVLRAHDL